MLLLLLHLLLIQRFRSLQLVCCRLHMVWSGGPLNPRQGDSPSRCLSPIPSRSYSISNLFTFQCMSGASEPRWNYFILHINITAPIVPPSPEEASKKLKGTLSPSFIQNQFPAEYKEVKRDEPMEVQLQKQLDKMGAQGWELINISTVGSKLLFFFKKPLAKDSAPWLKRCWRKLRKRLGS